MSITKTVNYTGTSLTIAILFDDTGEQKQRLHETAPYFDRPKGTWSANVTVNGVTQTRSGELFPSGQTTQNFIFTVPNQSSIDISGSATLITRYWIKWSNALETRDNTPETLTLNETVTNSVQMPTVNDVQLQITNEAYTEDSSGLRQVGGLVNWSANNVNVDGTQIDMYVQYKNTSDQVTHIQKILKTLTGSSGTFNFSFFDNPPYPVLSPNPIRVEIYFWLRDTATPISLSTFSQIDLQVENPTGNVPNAPALSVDSITENSARIVWIPPFDGGSPIVSYHIVVKNNQTGQTLYTLDQTTTNYNVLLLEPNTNYKAYVIAVNSNGSSLESNVAWTTNSVTIPPPPDPQNNSFTVTIDGSAFNKNYVILVSEGPIIDTHAFDPRVIFSNSVLTTNPVTHSAQAVITEIEFAVSQIPTTPPEPNAQSYTLELITASYLPTEQGKTVNIQASIKLIGNPANTLSASITIKQKLSGIVIYNEFQDMQVGGGVTFPLVFNIPDLPEATALIDYSISLFKSQTEFVALTQFPLIGSLEFTAPPTTPPPDHNDTKGSILHKIGGITALFGSLALLSTKR